VCVCVQWVLAEGAGTLGVVCGGDRMLSDPGFICSIQCLVTGLCTVQIFKTSGGCILALHHFRGSHHKKGKYNEKCVQAQPQA
jgi:hypothetical protein